MMAKVVGISASSVQRIWRAHGLQPHRVRQFQALQRPEVHRQAARRGRALCRSARPCHRPLGRRKIANPGARPHPARLANEEGPRRDHDPRLQTPTAQQRCSPLSTYSKGKVIGRCMQRHRHQEFYPLPQRHWRRRCPSERACT